MYRVLIIVAILNFAEPHRWCRTQGSPCHHPRHDYRRGHEQRLFEHLANDVIELDHKAKVFCNEFKEFTAKEIYDQDIYKFVVSLPNFNESTIEVKIKHRVLYVKAERDTDYKKYVALRILPELLSTTEAEWIYGNQELTVALPYKQSVRNVANLTCDDEINNNVISVRKSEQNPNEQPSIDMMVQTEPTNTNNLNAGSNLNITENVV